MVTNTVTYRDLDLNFTRNPATKDIAFRVGDQAVIRSIRNLVNLAFYEKPFHPEIGSGVTQILFEPMNPITAQHLKEHIIKVINNFESRAKIDQVVVQSREGTADFENDPQSVTIKSSEDRNQFEVFIRFYVQNRTTPTEITMFLERVR